MKRFLRLLTFVILLAATASCSWVKTTDTVSLQPKLCRDFVGLPADAVLNTMGQPASSETDTVAGIPVTKLCFKDRVVLRDFAGYSEKYQPEAPYIDIYLKNGKAFSVKTNLVTTRITKDEKVLSIVRLSVYAGVLLAAIIIALLIFIKARISVLENMDKTISKRERDLDALIKANRNMDMDIVKLKAVSKDMKSLYQDLVELKQEVFELKQGLRNENAGSEAPTKLTVDFSLLTDEEKKELLSRNIETLNLSVRALNCLKAADINTIGELCIWQKADFKHYRNMGRKSIYVIEESLSSLGLSFGMDLSEFGYKK